MTGPHPVPRLTSGHDCSVPGCDGLALYGMPHAGGLRWACAAHRPDIGFFDRPAAGHNAAAVAGPQACRTSPAPAAAPQGVLL